MTNREVCFDLAREMGGYNGSTDLELAGEELALDLSRDSGVDMDAEATIESIALLRSQCDVPLF